MIGNHRIWQMGNSREHGKPFLKITPLVHLINSQGLPDQGLQVQADLLQIQSLFSLVSYGRKKWMSEDRAAKAHLEEKSRQATGVIVMTVAQSQILDPGQVQGELGRVLQKERALPDIPKPLTAIAQGNEQRQSVLTSETILSRMIIA